MPNANRQKRLDEITAKILRCKQCLAAANGKIVPGEGNSRAVVAFIGEAPGKQESETGKPFIGRAGKVLRSLMEVAELKDDEVFITSAVKYLPKGYITPKPRDIEHGRTHLFEQLNAIVPKFVVLLGNVAAIAVLGEKFSIAKVHGTFIDRGGVTYFLSYHPAAPLYAPKLLAELKDDFIKLKQRINHETNN